MDTNDTNTLTRFIEHVLQTVLAVLATGWGLVLLVVAALLYFLPLLIAIYRQVPNAGSVAVVNVFLGWTFLGWVVALAMAVRSIPPWMAVPQRPVLVWPFERDEDDETDD